MGLLRSAEPGAIIFQWFGGEFETFPSLFGEGLGVGTIEASCRRAPPSAATHPGPSLKGRGEGASATGRQQSSLFAYFRDAALLSRIALNSLPFFQPGHLAERASSSPIV